MMSDRGFILNEFKNSLFVTRIGVTIFIFPTIKVQGIKLASRKTK